MIAELAEPRIGANVPRPFPRVRGGSGNETKFYASYLSNCSIELVEECNVLVTASVDGSLRIWTFEGHYIGKMHFFACARLTKYFRDTTIIIINLVCYYPYWGEISF